MTTITNTGLQIDKVIALNIDVDKNLLLNGDINYIALRCDID